METLLFDDDTEVRDDPQEKFLWTVDEHCDTLRKKAARVVERELIIASKWKRNVNVFESEKDAIAFMIDRANGKIGAANAQLLNAKKRLKKLRKKFGVTE